MGLHRKILATLAMALLGAIVHGQKSPSVEFVPDEILVKFKGTTSASTYYANLANRAIGARNLRVIPRIGVNHIRIPSGMSLDDAVFYYQRMSNVEYAEKNAKKKLLYNPNDSQFNTQYGPQKVKCPEAWNISKGSSNVIIAIVDTGIDLNHEDLVNKIVPGYDYSDNDNDPTASDDHGVHCAGIAAADTDNGKGVAGAGFNSRIMPLKIFPNATDAVSAAAIIHAADNGAKVISMSYGAYFESTTERNAINYAFNKGLVLVGGAANDNINNQFFPGAFDNVICVGSTGTNDVKSDFSNFGNDWVDVCAPGEHILSTITGGYANFDGTSMSTPLVAGVVALLWAQAIPGTTNVQIRQALESTTDPVPGNFFKFGRVNAFKAIQSLDPGSATLSDVTAVDIWTGAGSAGVATDLNLSDENFFAVTSAPTNLGQVGGAVVDIAFNGPANNLRESLALIEANGASGSSGQVFLWDYTKSKYVLIKAFALRPTGTKRERLLLPKDLTKYVSGGNLRMGIRAIGPNRVPRTWPKGAFELQLGFVQVSTRENFSN